MKKHLVSIFRVFFYSFIFAVIFYDYSNQFLITKSFINNSKDHLRIGTDRIRLTGTGSMYPTFPKGTGKTYQELRAEIVDAPEMKQYPSGFSLMGYKFFWYDIGYGDIVSFKNTKTIEITSKEGEPAGFVKRVVALPKDTIEIRGGIVFRNNQALIEPYIARARSTFGGETLAECTQLTVPKGFVFVMGDNRKGSLDSRHELGLVSLTDIQHVIPFADQRGTLDKSWHDTTKDLDDSSKIKLDIEDYLTLLNEERGRVGVKPLVYNKKLEKSATLRGRIVLKESEKNASEPYTLEQSMKDSGYRNIVWGESPDFGYYEAFELIEKQVAFPETKSFLENEDFQEIGIAEIEGTINGCPTQVIVQHFGGYKPPTYASNYKKTWEELLISLQKVQPEWKNLENFQGFYQDHKKDIDRINELLEYQIQNIKGIIATVEKNEWLTDEQNAFIDKLEKINQELGSLISKINSIE